MSDDEKAPGHELDHIDCHVCRAREQAELDRLKAQQNRWVQRCIMIAECLNRLRIIPRVIVAGYGWLVWIVAQWFMNLPDPGTQQAALVTTIVGAAGIIFGFYMQGGITAGASKGGSYGKK